jgi:two-component sensor histidine kinase
MNTLTLPFGHRSSLVPLMQLRRLWAGAGFLFAINLVLNICWLLDFALYELPQFGLALTFKHAIPFVADNLWATIPPQLAAAIILNLAPPRGWRRRVCLGAAFVWVVGWCFYWDPAGPFNHPWIKDPWGGLRYLAQELEQAITAGLFLWAYYYYRTAARAQDGLVTEQIAASTVDAELQRARLQLLRAQIEPHFLFNTLANIRTLARIERSAAVQLMDHLMQYFAAALPRLRQDESSLADEMQLIEAYLAIYRVRMGTRLEYQVSLPPELASERIPTMLLLTLVENALKHGVNPAVRGGEIRVSAMREHGMLILKVADSGAGLDAQLGHGSGLSNTCTRLRMRYGDGATLSLIPAEPRGVVALVRIPEAAGRMSAIA